MKRIVALILSLVFVLSFVGCKGKKDEGGPSGGPFASAEDKSADVVNGVEQGKIPEYPLTLSTTFQELYDYYYQLEAELQASHETGDGHVHHGDDIYMGIVKKEVYAYYEIDTTRYYYIRESNPTMVSAICTYGDAFGFKQGTSRAEVEASLASIEIKNLTAGEDELLFIPVQEALIIRYTQGDYQLDFYFSDNQLVATVLLDTKNWTI